MSGGFTENLQFRLEDLKEDIQKVIEYNNEEGGSGFSNETLDKIKGCMQSINKSVIYLHRVDKLLSGDDGEKEFHRKLKNDLDKVRFM